LYGLSEIDGGNYNDTRHSAPHQLINALNCEYQLRNLETDIERRLSL
jgi:hypothetical protein